LNGRRFDLVGNDRKTILEYRSQVATAINVFIENVDYESMVESLGASGQTGIRKGGAYDDGSLPSLMVFGLDLPYVFKPIVRQGTQLSEKEMMEEIRQRIGFVYSATVGYTDLSGYRFRDIADQTPLLQRHYDESERSLFQLIVDALFDATVTASSHKKTYRTAIPGSANSISSYRTMPEAKADASYSLTRSWPGFDRNTSPYTRNPSYSRPQYSPSLQFVQKNRVVPQRCDTTPKCSMCEKAIRTHSRKHPGISQSR
jgi:hypothetical protein